MNVAAGQLLEVKTGPSLPIRAVWFIFVGWWLSGLMMIIGWLAGIVVIGLPLTIYLVNRLPTFLTLRPRRNLMIAVTDASGQVRYQRLATEQYSLVVRAIYFILIGWWLSGIVMAVGWFLCATLILFPVGIMIINRVPFIYPLHRGYA
jgi:uncharacterized membrane protein YccF (DUF307 family)